MPEVGSLSMAAAGELRSPVSCSSEPDDSMEPYTTERLSRLPGGYRPLTDPFTALTIDFNDVQVSPRGRTSRFPFLSFRTTSVLQLPPAGAGGSELQAGAEVATGRHPAGGAGRSGCVVPAPPGRGQQSVHRTPGGHLLGASHLPRPQRRG